MNVSAWRTSRRRPALPALAALVVVTGHAGNAVAADAPPQLSVAGSAELVAGATYAVVIVEIDNGAARPGTAFQENLERQQRVVAAIGARRIPVNDVALDQVSVQRNWDDATRARHPFRAQSTLRIRVRNLDDVGPVVDEALAAGATGLQQIAYGTEYEDAARDAALAAAMRDARRQAEVLATAAGMRLGPLVEVIVDGAASPPVPLPRTDVALRAEAAALPVPGVVRDRVGVTTRWQLAPREAARGASD